VPTISRRLSLRAALAALLSSAACLAVVAGEATARESRGAQVVHAAGSTVKALQRALGIPADGIYGPQTRRAVRRFQRSHGLVVDGLAGPQTLGALGVGARTSRGGGGATAVLQRIAQCESGGNPRAVSPNRLYFGKYQFSRATWRSVGGSGNPAKASEAEQDRRARILYRRAGASPWPTCGR
jgi:Transglycosylase-like domain/Putative peptidoglycan binding domain